jgi:hypothetical protein
MKNIFKFAYVTLAVAAMAVCCSTDAFASPCNSACNAGQTACNASCASYCSTLGLITVPGACGACTGGCTAGANACNSACPVPVKPA